LAVPTLCTARLTLRQLELDDAGALHAVLSDEEVMRWWIVGPCTTPQDSADYVGRIIAKSPTLNCWAIVGSEGTAMGWVSLRHTSDGSGNLGYILGRANHSRGYAFEAASAIVAHAFDNLKWRRLVAEIDPDNSASAKLAGKLGFQFEGRLRQADVTHMGVRDRLVWSRLVID
jgi:[ribosomal protein S5]-alanine N-acetyltransferase